jgi:phosphate/sulfate permease
VVIRDQVCQAQCNTAVLLVQDARARWALLLAGAFGAYSLGANNIANVMGVFLLSVALQDLHISAWLVLSPTEELFLLGGLAIAGSGFTLDCSFSFHFPGARSLVVRFRCRIYFWFLYRVSRLLWLLCWGSGFFAPGAGVSVGRCWAK